MSPRRCDAEAMHAAAQSLLGKHDFTSFRAAACQAKSPVRTLDRLDVTRDGDVITIIAEARSFLHHQVRNLVGTLRLVGEGRWPVERVAAVLQARDRSAAGPTAPAEGLCLMRVVYRRPVPLQEASVGSPEASADDFTTGRYSRSASHAAPASPSPHPAPRPSSANTA